MSKHSMRLGGFGQIQRVLQRLLDGLRGRLQHAEALLEAVPGVGLDQRQHAPSSGPRCGVWISTLRPRFSESSSSSASRSSKSTGHVDAARDVLLVQIELLQQRGEELRRDRIRAGLPRRTRGGRRSARCAGGTGSPPPAAARRSRRRCRCRRPRRRPSSASPRISSTVADRSRSRRRLLEAHVLRGGLHARAQLRAPDRFAGLPETAARRAPRRRRSRPWSGPRTHGPRQRWMWYCRQGCG